MIVVSLDERALGDITSFLQRAPKKVPVIISRTLNRTLDMTKAEQVRRARDTYEIKAGKLRENYRVKKSNPGSLFGEIVSSGSPIALEHFKLSSKRRSKTPLKAAVKKGGLKTLGRRAFIAYQDGHGGAFARKTAKRIPIKRLYGLSAPQMLGEEGILEYLTGYSQEKFNERFQHEFEREMA